MNLPIQWFWVLAAVDGRMGVDRLLSVLFALGRDARDGAGYVFCNRAGNHLRVLLVNATGVWLCHRRLHAVQRRKILMLVCSKCRCHRV
jgi:transposase